MKADHQMYSEKVIIEAYNQTNNNLYLSHTQLYRVQHVVKFLRPSCGEAEDIAVPFQGLVLSMGGLARTVTG